jgi:hypothetical protein
VNRTRPTWLGAFRQLYAAGAPGLFPLDVGELTAWAEAGVLSARERYLLASDTELASAGDALGRAERDVVLVGALVNVLAPGTRWAERSATWCWWTSSLRTGAA